MPVDSVQAARLTFPTLHVAFLRLVLSAGFLALSSPEEYLLYAPFTGKCSQSLVRNAKRGIADAEWIKARKAKADKALTRWLTDTNLHCYMSDLSIVALIHSGGGYRAMLVDPFRRFPYFLRYLRKAERCLMCESSSEKSKNTFLFSSRQN